jgi:N-acetylmuramoyl-L-alanine amidase
MLKCIAKCSKGFDRCCFNCQLKELCNDACKIVDPKACEYHVHSEEVREKRRMSETEKKFWRIYIILFVLTLAVLIFGFSITGNQNFLMMQNTDILNTQNTIMQELDKQSIDDSEENRSEGDSVALTGEEFDLVTRIVMSESQSEPFDGKMAVAQTIRDRADTWDMTITEVCTADGQYAEPCDGEVSDDVKLAVADVFSGTSVLEIPTTHFYSGAEPYWAENKVNRGTIERHTFMY